MTGYSVPSAVRSVLSGRIVALFVAVAAMLIWTDGVSAQRGGSDRGGSARGGSARGGSGFGSMMQRGGRGGDDRGEQMRSFFSQMRSGGNASSGDRSSQMQSFFQRMREQRGGGERGASSRGESRGGSRAGRGRGSSKKGQTQPKPKVRVTIDLPEQYAGQDLDKDGQLGLYEWKLSAITRFRTLDTNRDGFLTPRELTVGDSTEETATASTSDTAASSESSDKKSDSPPSATVAVSTTATASGSKKDAGTVRIAKYTFKALDKDKDGKLTTAEWNASKRTRDTFKKKNVVLKLPIDEAGFVAAFPSRR